MFLKRAVKVIAVRKQQGMQCALCVACATVPRASSAVAANESASNLMHRYALQYFSAQTLQNVAAENQLQGLQQHLLG
jgi:tellurite resistance protein